MITLENVKQLQERGQVKHGWITQVAWSPDGKVLAVGCAKGVAMYVNGFGGAPDYLLPHQARVRSVAFHPTKPLVAVGGEDALIHLWTTPDKAIELQGHTDEVNTVAFSHSGQWLISGSADKTLRIWDVQHSSEHAALLMHRDKVNCVEILDDDLIATGSRDKNVYILSLDNLLMRSTIVLDDWVRRLNFNRTAKMIAAASKDGRVHLWSLNSPETQAIIEAHDGGVDSVAFSPDGSLLATGGRDNVIRLWDVAVIQRTHKASMVDAVLTLRAHDKPVLALAFNPAGTMLVSGSGDNRVRLWSV